MALSVAIWNRCTDSVFSLQYFIYWVKYTMFEIYSLSTYYLHCATAICTFVSLVLVLVSQVVRLWSFPCHCAVGCIHLSCYPRSPTHRQQNHYLLHCATVDSVNQQCPTQYSTCFNSNLSNRPRSIVAHWYVLRVQVGPKHRHEISCHSYHNNDNHFSNKQNYN